MIDRHIPNNIHEDDYMKKTKIKLLSKFIIFISESRLKKTNFPSNPRNFADQMMIFTFPVTKRTDIRRLTWKFLVKLCVFFSAERLLFFFVCFDFRRKSWKFCVFCNKLRTTTVGIRSPKRHVVSSIFERQISRKRHKLLSPAVLSPARNLQASFADCRRHFKPWFK